jgi:hypothetical protein
MIEDLEKNFDLINGSQHVEKNSSPSLDNNHFLTENELETIILRVIDSNELKQVSPNPVNLDSDMEQRFELIDLKLNFLYKNLKIVSVMSIATAVFVLGGSVLFWLKKKP